MKLFVQNSSIVRRLQISSIVMALLVPMLCIGFWLSSEAQLSGLAEIDRINRVNTHSQQILAILESQMEMLERIRVDGVQTESRTVFDKLKETAMSRIEEAISEASDKKVVESLYQIKNIKRELAGSFGRVFAGEDLEREQMLIRQFNLEERDVLARTQIHLQHRVADTFDRIYQQRYFPIQVGAILSVMFTALALLLGLSTASRLRRSVENLLEATHAVGVGNLAFRAPVLGQDEIGRITDSFNRMTDSLRSTTVSRDYVMRVVESMLDPVIVLGTDNKIRTVNHRTWELLGYTEAELVGKDLNTLFAGGTPAVEKRGRNQEAILITKSRLEVPVLVSMAVISEGDHADGMVCVIKDITERKQAENQLQAAHAALVTANEDLESFSYSVSHDLRAPLRSIDGFSQILLDDHGAKLDEQGRGYLNRVRSAAGRMGELIDALLGLAKITRGELRKQKVDLSAMARKIGEDFKLDQPDRQVELKITDGIVVDGDPNLLKVVLENLLNNAFKFTSKRPQAIIEFGSTVIEGKPTYFVRDNGAGFDMTYANKLFGVFQRLHDQTQFGGTGIGLATVRRIISRHGGQIYAESAVDQGTTFFFKV